MSAPHQGPESDSGPGHDHGADHAHDHTHLHHGIGHTHAPLDFGKAFAVGIALNGAFVVVEAVFGFISHSLALVADAGHNFGDVLGLVIAWIAASVSKQQATARHTYGYKRSSILAAFLNALLLLGSMGAVAWEAIRRLHQHAAVSAETIIWVSAIGIVINGMTAWMFMAGRKHDINIRAAYLHMAADALISAGVVAAGVAIAYTQWMWLDPVVSLVIVAIIVWSTWGLFRDSLNFSLDAVPPGIDARAVRAYLQNQPGVKDVHDLHIWPLSTTETALTAHLVIEGNSLNGDLLHFLHHKLEDEFEIHHVTIQLEPDGVKACLTNSCN